MNELEIKGPGDIGAKFSGHCSWIIVVLLIICVFGGLAMYVEVLGLQSDLGALEAKLQNCNDLVQQIVAKLESTSP